MLSAHVLLLQFPAPNPLGKQSSLVGLEQKVWLLLSIKFGSITVVDVILSKKKKIMKKNTHTLDKKTWINIVCLAIGLSSANMIYGLLQGEYEDHGVSSGNIVGSIGGIGVFILVAYLFYRYRIFNYHVDSSALRHKWFAAIPPLFIICSLLLGHYIYPKLWDCVVIGLIAGVVSLLLQGLIFLFEKVLKMNKVS